MISWKIYTIMGYEYMVINIFTIIEYLISF
jgi:hypothetical protein